MFVDSHAHLTAEEMTLPLDGVLMRAKEAGVENIINICVDPESLRKGIELKKSYPWIYNTGATTPHDAEIEGSEKFPVFEEAAKRGDLVAIGETGLEYHHCPETKEVQKRLFSRYLDLAKKCNLPVIVHCRDAFSDLFTILDQEYRSLSGWHPGVLHCFTGTEEEADEVIRRGWYVSLSGIVTFKNGESLRRVAKRIPLTQLLIETDAPWLAPQRRRGKMNEPAFLPEIGETIARERGVEIEVIARATKENAKRIFNI